MERLQLLGFKTLSRPLAAESHSEHPLSAQHIGRHSGGWASRTRIHRTSSPHQGHRAPPAGIRGGGEEGRQKADCPLNHSEVIVVPAPGPL